MEERRRSEGLKREVEVTKTERKGRETVRKESRAGATRQRKERKDRTERRKDRGRAE